MATNFVQCGEVITYANTGSAISAGDVVVVGKLLGVAAVDIAATTGTGSVYIEGVFTLPKVTGVAWTSGMKLDWDSSVGKFDTVAHIVGGLASGDVSVNAVAFGAAGSTAATGKVLINVSPGTVT